MSQHKHCTFSFLSSSKNIFCILLFLVSGSFIFSQSITLSGFVFGYKGENVLMFKKMKKNVSFEGSLGDAAVSVHGNSADISVKTNLTGSFSVNLKAPGEYKINVQHPGFSTIVFDVNYKDAGEKNVFGSFYLLLKEGDKTSTHVGSMSIDNGGQMNFSTDNSDKDKSKGDILNSNASLLEKAAMINNSPQAKSFYSPLYTPKPAQKISPKENKIKNDSISSIIKNREGADKAWLIKTMMNEDIDTLKNEVTTAKKMLGTLDPGGKEYKLLLQQIKIAEAALAEKELIIQMQTAQLELTRKKMLFLTLFSIAIVLLALFLLFYIQQKKKFNKSLEEKNKKITSVNTKLLSGIRFASLIQNSLLQSAERIKQFFPDVFVYNRPKDIVSGDFYWCAKKNDHTIIVTADCTGHGVPGAMLTILGHNALEEIVNIHGETTPSRIIMLMSHLIRATFANSPEHVECGMDLTVLCIPDNDNHILFSGAVSGIFVVQKNKIRHLAVTPKSLGDELTESELEDQKIIIGSGDSIFMFTDGYHDQFSGNKQKIEKLNISRFEKMLLEISARKEFNESGTQLDQNLADWKGEREQVDDILIVGIRF
jgi:serine phosphatase RsbU (regulator of sigma subunit)